MQVHGIKVPDVIDELIEWDADEGATEYELNKLTHKLHVVSIVPREDTPKGRLVTQHEFLHAEFDNPKTRKYSSLEDSVAFWATNGVADAFVHLVYWPVGRDKQADKEAALIALSDLRATAEQSAEAKTNGEGVDNGKLLEITLRAMSILKAVGTTVQQMEGSTLILSYLTANQLGQLNTVLDVVRRKDRDQALKLMAAIT